MLARCRHLLTSALLICAPGFTGSAPACLNESGVLELNLKPLQGEEIKFESSHIHYFRDYPQVFRTHPTADEWTSREAEIKAKLSATKTPGPDLQTSYAVTLVHLGRYPEALEIFKALELKSPGLYGNAANLGTTYELLGDTSSALQWIREGLKRNPDSHQGTEWLHVRILEAKTALQADPHWMETHSVLGLDWGNNLRVSRPRELTKAEWPRFSLALQHQLYERIEFVHPPDLVVGDLLYDLANMAAFSKNAKGAVPLYKFSMEYGTPRQDMADKRAMFYGLMAILDISLIATVFFLFIFFILLAVGIRLIRKTFYVMKKT